MRIEKRDLIIEYSRASGPGGQRRNKKETAVKITHIPTGISVFASERRSQAQNKEVALKRLEERIIRFKKRKKKRITTKIPKAIKERILQRKKRHSEKKKLRYRLVPRNLSS